MSKVSYQWQANYLNWFIEYELINCFLFYLMHKLGTACFSIIWCSIWTNVLRDFNSLCNTCRFFYFKYFDGSYESIFSDFFKKCQAQMCYSKINVLSKYLFKFSTPGSVQMSHSEKKTCVNVVPPLWKHSRKYELSVGHLTVQTNYCEAHYIQLVLWSNTLFLE